MIMAHTEAVLLNMTLFFREIIKKIKGDENTSIVDALEGRKTVEIIEAVHLSAETGKEISLPLN